MALSNCERCWNSPCLCGWRYRNWSAESREHLAATALGVRLSSLKAKITAPEKHPKLQNEQWSIFDNAESRELRNFRWAYGLLAALAKEQLRRANETAGPGEWPAGQTWEQLGSSSKAAFLQQARQLAGIPDDEFLDGIRDGTYDVEDLHYGTASQDQS